MTQQGLTGTLQTQSQQSQFGSEGSLASQQSMSGFSQDSFIGTDDFRSQGDNLLSQDSSMGVCLA